MAKPTDLTRKSWDKAKELTVPKTGFGDKLDAYRAARKKTEDLPTRNLAAFKAAATALDAVTKHVPVALGKCNKTLHKSTIEALGAYKGLIDKEGLALSSEFTKYQGYVDKYKNLRDVCGKEMKQIRAKLDALVAKTVPGAKAGAAAGKADVVEKLVNATKAELTKIQKEADDSIAKPRIPGPAAETPHADDRPDASVFTALITAQSDIIAVRKKAEGDLDAALDAAKKRQALTAGRQQGS